MGDETSGTQSMEWASQAMDDIGSDAGAGGPSFSDYTDAVVESVVTDAYVAARDGVEDWYQSSDVDASQPPSGADTDPSDWSSAPSQ